MKQICFLSSPIFFVTTVSSWNLWRNFTWKYIADIGCQLFYNIEYIYLQNIHIAFFLTLSGNKEQFGHPKLTDNHRRTFIILFWTKYHLVRFHTERYLIYKPFISIFDNLEIRNFNFYNFVITLSKGRNNMLNSKTILIRIFLLIFRNVEVLAWFWSLLLTQFAIYFFCSSCKKNDLNQNIYMFYIWV